MGTGGRSFTVRVADTAFEVPAGEPLHQALLRHDFYVETPCGARGACRKCRVKLAAGPESRLPGTEPDGGMPGPGLTGTLPGAAPGSAPPEPTPAERAQLSQEELDLGYRLACQHRVDRNLRVAIIPEAAVDAKKARLSRLAAGAAPLDPWADLSLSPTGRALGLAIDLGTTSIVGALLDLQTGEELASRSLGNPQAPHGADLMSRLGYAMRGEAEQEELRQLALGGINRLVRQLLARVDGAPEEVVAATVVGNTAMHHLLLGLDPTSLGEAPYEPVIRDGVSRQATELGLELHPEAEVYILPTIGGFVGADTVGVLLNTDLAGQLGPAIAVDIGTNGEVAGYANGRLVVASAPAGPAFEGGAIYQGMRGVPGAIEAVRVVQTLKGPDLKVEVIGKKPPAGICGSGLLDAAAALLATRLLDPQGLLGAHPGAAPLVVKRLVEGPWGRGLILAEGPGGPVVLSQQDIRQLQLAKGAVSSGIRLVMEELGLAPEDLRVLLLAGAFGNYLRPESAVATGLIPRLPLERIRPVGNAAAMGGKQALLSAAARRQAEILARRAEHLDLALRPEFQEIFLGSLNFPGA